MSTLIVRDMTPDDEAYAGTCSHVGESAETDAAGAERVAWLRTRYDSGVRMKVALLAGVPSGLACLHPSEAAPTGPDAPGLLVLSCLWVPPAGGRRGVGNALIEAALAEARQQGRLGLVTVAYANSDWFMPAAYFARHGFVVADTAGDAVAAWRPLDAATQPPRLSPRRYTFEPPARRLAVDLYWSPACLTMVVEARRVRAVAAEFGDQLELREHRTDDPSVRAATGIARGIFVNGREVGWGYAAPTEALRETFATALSATPAR